MNRGIASTTIIADSPWDRRLKLNNRPSMPTNCVKGREHKRGSEHTLPKCPMPPTSSVKPAMTTTRGVRRVVPNNAGSNVANNPLGYDREDGRASPGTRTRTSFQPFVIPEAAPKIVDDAKRGGLPPRSKTLPQKLYPANNEICGVSVRNLVMGRQPSQVWSAKMNQEPASERPEVTCPSGAVRRVNSVSTLRVQYEEDDESLTPSFFDASLSGGGALSAEGGGGMSGSSSNTSNSGNKSRETSPCRALDKFYLKRLASEHRTNVSAHRRTRINPSYSSQHSIDTFAHETFANETFVTTMSSHYQPPTTTKQQQALPQSSLHSYEKKPAAVATTMVEIWPGVTAPLRGSDETQKAVASGFYTSTTCFGCGSDIYCIADVQYTICPLCRVFSPVDENNKPCDGGGRARWGLGLGFTRDSLWSMQCQR